MNESNADTIDLIELWHEIWKKIYIVVILAVVCGVIGWGYTRFMVTPLYEANVTMIVNSRQDVNVTLTNDQIVSSQKLVATYSVIIKSNTVLDQVIENLGLETTYSRLADRISVSAVNDTQVMRISVRHPDRETAYRIIDEIASLAPEILVDTVEAGSCKVISRVTVSEGPVSPSIIRNTLLAVFVGLVVAIAIIVIRYLSKERHIVDDDDVIKYLDLPVLGVIPWVGGSEHEE